MIRNATSSLLALVCWSFSLTATAPAAVLPASPSPHYVLDEAGWLGAPAFQALDARMQPHEREASSPTP